MQDDWGGFGGQSLVVELWDEESLLGQGGEVIDRCGGPPLNAVLSRALDESFTMLRYVDPYDNTVFNHLQASELASEAKRLRTHARSDVEARTVESFIALVERCVGEGLTYVVFIGD